MMFPCLIPAVSYEFDYVIVNYFVPWKHEYTDYYVQLTMNLHVTCWPSNIKSCIL